MAATLSDETSRGREHRYSTRLSWTGNTGPGTSEYGAYGRSYTVDVDGKPTLAGSADASFLGDPTRHNPEDLFLAAISGCHMLSYLALCARQGVTVTLASGADATLAEARHHTAHLRCFIANSGSAPIRCDATVRSEEAASARTSGGAP